MIDNQWYVALDSKELKANKPIGLTRFGKKIALWRDGNEVNCIIDRCCHRGAALHKGKLKKGHIECPFHGFQYDTSGKVKLIPANGTYAEIPARFKVQAFHAVDAYGFIWIYYSTKPYDEIAKESLPEIPFFKELRKNFYYTGFSEVWPVHYTRAIENQLDVVHLPFVHKTTIGRGNATLVNGPVVKWEDNLMTFYVLNEVDQGQTPRKPKDIPDSDLGFHLQFQMPNLWQNILGDGVRIVAGFVPVDDAHTKIYLRFYQNAIGSPLLKPFVKLATNWSNKIILHQDRRVVITQEPIKSELVMDEMLIQGDLPIMEFRKIRESLKGESK